MKYKVASTQKTIEYLEIDGKVYGIKEMIYAVDKLLECQPYVGRGYILVRSGMDEFMKYPLAVLAKEGMAKEVTDSDGEVYGYLPNGDEGKARLSEFKKQLQEIYDDATKKGCYVGDLSGRVNILIKNNFSESN